MWSSLTLKHNDESFGFWTNENNVGVAVLFTKKSYNLFKTYCLVHGLMVFFFLYVVFFQHNLWFSMLSCIADTCVPG